MSEALPTYIPMTCEATPSVISSLASGDGLLPSDSPDGQTFDLFGPVPAPVSPIRLRGSAKARTIHATYGRPSAGSFASDAPAVSLASRLSQRFGGDGLTVLPTIWKAKRTPSGRLYYQLAASARIIAGIGSTGMRVPTPAACDHKGSGTPRAGRGPTNNLRDWFRQKYGFLYPPVRLVAYLMGYPTAWLDSLASVTPLSRKSPPPSSRRT